MSDKKEKEPIEEGKENEEAKSVEKKKELSPEEQLKIRIKGNMELLRRGRREKDSRLVARVGRDISSLRKLLVADVLRQQIAESYQVEHPTRVALLEALAQVAKVEPEKMEDDEAEGEVSGQAGPELEENQGAEEEAAELVAETDVYLQLLVLVLLLDKKQHAEGRVVADGLVEFLRLHGSRTFSALASKAFFYYARTYELLGRAAATHDTLLAAHRTAGLHHDEELQATILNCLLRQHVLRNEYKQADNLLNNTHFDESAVSANQLARFLYYKARILSVQGQYQPAGELLGQSLRRAPQFSALGFRVTLHKWSTVVQLLRGNIPAKSLFFQPELRTPLKPYFALAQAVRDGNLAEFQGAVSTHQSTFQRDNTHVLVARLRTNVIKAGLRRINLAYSRISLEDIRGKLLLDSTERVEFIVAKAIRDGVIDASINHADSYLQSKETDDIYSTGEPADTFHHKIQFCFNLHNDAVTAMRFPPEVLQATQPRPRYDDSDDDDDDDDDDNNDNTTTNTDKKKENDKN